MANEKGLITQEADHPGITRKRALAADGRALSILRVHSLIGCEAIGVGLRFPEGVNVVIARALAGPGLDATDVRVVRPPRGSAGRTMGFMVRSRAGVFELMARPRVVRAEDIHTVAASVIAMLGRETAGSVIGQDRPRAPR